MRTDLLLDGFDTLVRTPEDVAELEEAILNLAVRGQLVPQDPDDEPATELLKQIRAERKQLIQEKKITRGKRLPAIREEDIPYPVPGDWLWCRLPEIYRDWGQGKPEDDFTYIDVSSIDNRVGIIGNDLAVLPPEEAPSRARKQVRQGTVIYSTVRPYLLNVAVVDRDYDPPPIVSTAFEVMHPLEGVYKKYLYYYLRSQPFTDFVESQMTGMAYPAISKSKLSRGLFPLSPLAEQKRIVARVDELLVQTRALAAQLEAADEALVPAAQASFQVLVDAPDRAQQSEAWRRISNAFDALTADPRTIDALKQTILQLAVRGKLVPQDPDDEPASVLLQRIKDEKQELLRNKAIAKPKPVSEILPSEIPYAGPVRWQWVRLGEVIHDLRYGTSKKCTYGRVGVPVLRIPNITTSGQIDLEDLKYTQLPPQQVERLSLETGDLLLIRSNGSTSLVGRTAVVYEDAAGYTYAGYLIRLRPSKSNVFPKYLYIALESRHTRDQIELPIRTTTGVKNINSQEVSNLLIPLPPLAEQKRIVANVESLLALCDALAAEVVAAEEVRGRLLAAVLNGE